MSDEAILREKAATLTRMLNWQGTIGNVRPHLGAGAGHRPLASSARAPRPTRPSCAPEHMFVYNIDGSIIEHPGGLIPASSGASTHKSIATGRTPCAWCTCTRRTPRALGIARHGADAGVPARLVSLHGGVPTWDNPRLVVNDEQAADLSQRARRQDRCCQMRGHGTRGGRRERRGGVLRLHVPGGERADPAAGRDHGRRHPAQSTTRRATAPKARSTRGCFRCCGSSTSAKSRFLLDWNEVLSRKMPSGTGKSASESSRNPGRFRRVGMRL